MATYNGHNEDASGNILLSIGNGMTATLETGTTASQAYTKGAYLYYNNRLCKVTAAIASGNTLTIGTNIAYTSLGAELTSHLKATNGDEFYFDYKDGEPGYYPSASKTASQFVPLGGTSAPYDYLFIVGGAYRSSDSAAAGVLNCAIYDFNTNEMWFGRLNKTESVTVDDFTYNSNLYNRAGSFTITKSGTIYSAALSVNGETTSLATTEQYTANTSYTVPSNTWQYMRIYAFKAN